MENVIPLSVVAAALRCAPVTAVRACERHGVPVIRLSPKKRGLTEANYVLLLERAAQSHVSHQSQPRELRLVKPNAS